jgi:hypothetical protein
MMKKLFRMPRFLLFIITSIILFHLSPIQAKESAVYINEDLNFSIEYPKNWIYGKKYNPDAVLQVNDPSGIPDLGITVTDLNKNKDLNNSPEEWINDVKRIPGTDNFKIVYKKNIKLNDGTNAVKARISWTIKKMPFMTSFVAFDKNDKRIKINSSGMANISFKVMEGITDSLNFNE